MIKVFLVDDEYFLRTSLKQNIPWRENGFQVIGEANNGNTAFEMICDCKPDIGIIDINMPGCTGIELIRKLNDENINCQYIILTGYDEFEYAKQAITLSAHDYLLKPIDYNAFITSINELKRKILSNRTQQKTLHTLENLSYEYQMEQYFNDVVSYRLSHDNNFYQNANNINAFPLPAYLAFRVIIFVFKQRISKTEVKACLENTPFSCDYFFYKGERTYYIICEDTSSEGFSHLVKHLVTVMKEQGMKVNLGVGNSYSSLNQLNLSYTEAQIALKNISAHEEVNFLFYEQLNDTNSLALLDQKTKNRIKSLMLSGEMAPLDIYLKEIFKNFTGQKNSFDQVMLLSIQLISIPFELLSALSDFPISFYKETESVLARLTGSGDLDGIEDEVSNIYRAYFQRVKELPTTPEKISDKIANFIETNYHEANLTIPTIADHLHLNYSYLCTCFKQDKGITIIEYLNEVRIQNAVKLFNQGVVNVTYVSEKCGYLTPAYFSKRFKKVTGLSPSDYIKVNSTNI